jgi:hypothetical protein
MKRFILALFTVTLLGTSFHDARAIGAFVSWWNMDAANEDGFGGGLRQPIKIIPILSIDTRASWVNFSDSDVNVFPLEAVGIVSLGLLYGGLGVGYYIFDADPSIENSFVPHLAGVAQLTGASVFGEVKWTVSGDFENIDVNRQRRPASTPPESASTSACSLGFSATASWPFPALLLTHGGHALARSPIWRSASFCCLSTRAAEARWVRNHRPDGGGRRLPASDVGTAAIGFGLRFDQATRRVRSRSDHRPVPRRERGGARSADALRRTARPMVTPGIHYRR